MRQAGGQITCDHCKKDITGAYLMCDRLTGEWCRECFADCPLPLTSDKCWGEGCPTLVAEASDPDPKAHEDPAIQPVWVRLYEAECKQIQSDRNDQTSI